MSAALAKSNPFPGLRPFTQAEDFLFFGREEQTLELLQRLGGCRFVAVVGTSGSGKSSLVRCGLLSELLGGGMLGAGSSWEIAVTHPGGNPLSLLTDALLVADLYDRDQEHARENLLATLSRSQFGLVEAVKQADLGEKINFLLVVDQFEEIFRFHEAGQWQQEAANEFVSLLLEAAGQRETPIYVVLTMRSDFIGECGQFEGLAEMVNRGEFLIPRLTREQYKRAIEGPIKVAGGQIEPRLLQRLLNDLGQQADQLPCLQHALMRTWDVWAAKGDTEALDLDEYQLVGRMSQALSLHADEIHDALASDRQRELCKGMFQALTAEESNSRGIRRPQRLGRLCQILEVPAEELLPIIDAYRRSGVTFLTPSPEVALTDQTIIDLSHESLMRVWTRLRQWVEEETQAAGIYHRLSESASLNEQGEAGLYRDPELGIALAWRQAKRPNAAWAERYRPGFAGAMGFLEASQQASVAEEQARDAARQQELERSRQLAETQARAARLFKRFAGVLAAGLCLAVALTAWAFLLWQEAIRQEAAATFYAGEANVQAKLATENAKKAEASARKAEAEAEAARSAEQEAKERAKAEAAAKALAEQERQRANDNARKADDNAKKADERAAAAHKAEEQVKVQLTRAEWLVYAGKLTLAQNDFEAGNGGFAQRYLDECQPNLRGWEHRYLWTRISAKQTWAGNTGEVWSVAYSPDGKRVVVGSQKNAMVWDAEKGEELLALKGHTRPVRSVAYSSDGKRIVTGGGDPGAPAEAKVWDAATGRQLLDLKGIRGEVWSVAFSPDGGRVVTGAGNRTGGPGEAKVWDARTGKGLFTINCPVRVAGVAFSPDGKRIVTGAGLFHANSLSELKVWDAETGKELLALKGHKQGVMSVAYSPDGKRIVSGAGNPSGGETKVWDAGTGQEIFTLKGHAGGVSSVAFSPDNLRIITGSSDNTMKLWDAATGAELLTLKGHLDGVTSVAFSPDGRRVATGGVDQKVKVWDAESGQEVLAVKTQGGVRGVAFSRDGNRVATGSDGQSTKVWDARTGREVLDMNTGGVAVAFSPDGKHIATDAGVRDAETGKQVLSLKGHAGSIRSVAYRPDGKRIATASEDHTAKVWDAESGKQILTLKGHTGGLTSVAFSLDGKRIVTGGDSAAKVWDADKGRELLSLKGHTGPIRCVAFSPDGKRVVTGSSDRTARVWDAENGRQIVVLEGHTNWVNGVAFSSDGKRLATASEDKTVKVWDADKGQELLTLKGHTHVVFAVAFSPDGKRLVTGSYDQTAKVWNAEKSPESRDAAWPQPDAAERKRHHAEQSALALQQKQWFAAEFHLGRVLRDDPENAVAKSRLAQIPFVIASDQKKFALAARLWAEALAKDPKTGDDLQTQPRYHAACTAALAAAGQGMDEPALDDATKAKLRLQALEGLKAELTALDKLPESSWPKAKPGDWRRDSDLASVRDPAALAKLPAAEQMQWQTFWAEVAAFASSGEHFQRGVDLSRQGNFVESVTEYRAAIRRRPDFAEAYCNLGLLLGKQGDYAEALEMRRKGHELGSQRSDWKYPSAQWVAQAERAQALSKRLPAVLQGKDKAADNAERLAFAQIAYDQHQFAAASRFWGDALANNPKLGDDRQTQHRYNAACAAALAAAGQGKGEPPLDDAAKGKLRRQALDSLKIELAVWDKLLASGPPQNRTFLAQTLKHWQKDADLAGIRDKAALAKLPADEQKALAQLWADVATLMKRAEP